MIPKRELLTFKEAWGAAQEGNLIYLPGWDLDVIKTGDYSLDVRKIINIAGESILNFTTWRMSTQ